MSKVSSSPSTNQTLIEDPVSLAKGRGVTSHFFSDLEQLTAALKASFQEEPQLELEDGGRNLPCYSIRIEEFFTPVCYDPPASREFLLAWDQEADEWLLVGAVWLSGISEIMLASHIYMDELEMIISAIEKSSGKAKVRVYPAARILPVKRTMNIEMRMEAQ